jgi:hypothetical protein
MIPQAHCFPKKRGRGKYQRPPAFTGETEHFVIIAWRIVGAISTL